MDAKLFGRCVYLGGIHIATQGTLALPGRVAVHKAPKDGA